MWDSTGPREPGETFHVAGTTTFRWTATDIKGNASAGQQTAHGRTADARWRSTYGLTDAATLQVTVTRRNGSPAWSSCPARRGKRPGTYKPVVTERVPGQQGEQTEPIGTASRKAPGTVRIKLRAGRARGTVSLARILQGKKLRPGTYWLEVSSLDAKGKPSVSRCVKFRVLKARPR